MKNANARKDVRRTDEDGKILTGCKKCRYKRSCDLSDGLMQCPYEEGMSPHYVFHVGKHKGETVERVAETDPQYLLWMTANVKWFQLSAVAREKLVRENEGYDKKMYAAEVKREEKFISNKTNQNDEDEIVCADDDTPADGQTESE
jgi:hypothetical protein